MKLIVNADDFGLSKAVNIGILEAYENGIVTSTSIMANMLAAQHAFGLWKDHQGLGVGVHLNLTLGRPITEGLKTLVDDNGNFLKPGVLQDSLEKIDLFEVKTEFTAQIEKIIKAGFKINHLNGHDHVHSYGSIPAVTLELCKKYSLGCRYIFDGGIGMLENNGIKTTCNFSSGFYNDDATQEYLIRFLEICLKDPSLEIMCHPAYIDKALYESSAYCQKRIYELDVLTSDAVKDFVKKNNIQLCSYSDL